MLLAAMQDRLSSLYETPIEHRVMDYLVTDARIADALEQAATPRANAERLLLRQSEDSLDVALYIDTRIMEALADLDPHTCLDARNLNDFLTALEGVSHFNYLVWNALHERQVTQLELELQAEIDKYVVATMLLDEQGTAADADHFHTAMFTFVVFDPDLDAPAEQRYRDANHYAAKYCRRLTRQFPAQHREPSFINELRRFYRLSRNDKIRCIDNGVA